MSSPRHSRRNETHGKDLQFVIATNLALLDDDILDFCAREDIDLSTSLDGPEDLHNANRRRPGQDSWAKAVAGIKAVQDRLGPDRVSALMTTTEASLDRVKEIIDTYVELGLNSVFLRPVSPYGFAMRRRGGVGYDVDRWLEFYNEGLDHIIELNRRGVAIAEVYTSIVAKKIFTNDDPGYIDLTSPAGIGIGGAGLQLRRRRLRLRRGTHARRDAATTHSGWATCTTTATRTLLAPTRCSTR